MFCPNCGAKNSSSQSFCHACGLNLEQSARSLLEQVPLAGKNELTKGRMGLERLGKLAFGGMIVVGLAAVIGLIYTIFEKFILGGSGVIAGIIFILLLVFAVLGLTYVIFNENLKERRLDVKNSHMETSESIKLLDEKPIEPVPSVIEDTTDLLFIKNKTRKLE